MGGAGGGGGFGFPEFVEDAEVLPPSGVWASSQNQELSERRLVTGYTFLRSPHVRRIRIRLPVGRRTPMASFSRKLMAWAQEKIGGGKLGAS